MDFCDWFYLLWWVLLALMFNGHWSLWDVYWPVFGVRMWRVKFHTILLWSQYQIYVFADQWCCLKPHSHLSLWLYMYEFAIPLMTFSLYHRKSILRIWFVNTEEVTSLNPENLPTFSTLQSIYFYKASEPHERYIHHFKKVVLNAQHFLSWVQCPQEYPT